MTKAGPLLADRLGMMIGKAPDGGAQAVSA